MKCERCGHEHDDRETCCEGYAYCSGLLPEPMRERCLREEGHEHCDRGFYVENKELDAKIIKEIINDKILKDETR